MTLPAAFPINTQQINVELGRAPGAAFNMLGAEERVLAQVPSGTVSMGNFLGKSNHDVTTVHISSTASEVASYGADVTGRWVVVLAIGSDPGGVIAATVSGAPAIIIAQNGNTFSGVGESCSILVAQPSGTSGLVSLSGGGTPKRFYLLRTTGYNLSSAIFAANAAANGVPPWSSVPIAANGFAVGVAMNDGSVGGAPSWTGLTNRELNTITISGKRNSIAWDFNMAASGGRLIDFNPANDGAGATTGCVASFA